MARSATACSGPSSRTGVRCWDSSQPAAPRTMAPTPSVTVYPLGGRHSDPMRGADADRKSAADALRKERQRSDVCRSAVKRPARPVLASAHRKRRPAPRERPFCMQEARLCQGSRRAGTFNLTCPAPCCTQTLIPIFAHLWKECRRSPLGAIRSGSSELQCASCRAGARSRETYRSKMRRSAMGKERTRSV